jgi:predicted P-loop ATPase
MIADSESYTFLNDPKKLKSCRDEFKRNNNKMLAKWIEHWQTGQGPH